MNESDSERIDSYLQSNGFCNTKKEQANILIFNACAVRQSAVDRIYGQINNTKSAVKGKKSKVKIIIITGCVLPSDKKKFTKNNILILDIKDLPYWKTQITKTLKHLNTRLPVPDVAGYGRQVKIKKYHGRDYFRIPAKHNTAYTAYVPIMTGCNNFCTYCAVPYARGREQSRPANDIIKEIKKLIKAGYQEIILLGQNVNSYQGVLNKNLKIKNLNLFKNSKIKNSKIINFPTLLKLIDTIPGNYWLNFYSAHPKDLSDDLINCFKTCQHLTPYLHLPLQSGSNKILKKMNRHYTVAHYTKLINQVRKTNPNISITTDVIVGFPGETLADFKATTALAQTIKFDLIYISQFSPRPHTVAAEFEDNVTNAEKDRREKTLNKTLKKIALKNNQQKLNQTLDVLVDNFKNKNIFGHTNQFKRVKITIDNKINNEQLIGQFIQVKITNSTSWHLKGKIIKNI